MKKFGFETSPRQGHEFWNNEADAFKHAFGSADMVLNMGYLGSLIGGLHHEFKTKTILMENGTWTPGTTMKAVKLLMK